MIPIRYTRNLFLRAICVIYLFAFLSHYIQTPGLYGDNGVLPARSLLENSKHKTLSAKVHYQPTLLWLAPYLGLDTQYAMDVLSLLGSFLAFTGFVSQKFCTIPLFAGLWSLYFSVYQVGQVFVTSQWDDLLLEAGFISLLVAPLLPGRRRGSKGSPRDSISFWLVRWLLFRFILSSGLVKLLSGCPKWWDLNALNSHFESMVIPSPLAWYTHHLPVWFLRLSTVFTNVCELVLPFLFFAPIRSIRFSAFVVQLFLQISIVLTGNFGILNLLMVTLLISLLDDQSFLGKQRKINGNWAFVGQIVNLLLHAGIIYAVVVFYDLKINGSQIDAKIAFSKDQFDAVVRQGILVTIYLSLASLSLTVIRALVSSVADNVGTATKFFSLLNTLFYSAVAILLFTASTVPLSSLHKSTNSTITPSLRTIYNRFAKLHAVNQYGIIKKMSDTNAGRPEIIIEGSDNLEGPWLEYNFLYKPGNVNHSLPYVVPYSPRLDWQIWWAAQNNNYQNEPWLLSLAYRLLHGRPEILALIDRHHSPFNQKSPKYIRASLYNYQYTSWEQRGAPTWWKRERMGEYFPAFTKDSPVLVDYLKARNLFPTPSKQVVNPVWKYVLDSIRYMTSHFEPSLLLWSVFTAGCALITTTTKN